MKSLCWILFVCLIAPASQRAQHTKDSLKTVQQGLKDKKAVLIDVREKSEWDKGHLQDAALVPLSELKKKGKLSAELSKKLPKNKVIYCHCQAGGRVLSAFSILKKQGYDIRPLKQGYPDLVKAGFAKAKSKPKDKK